MAELLVLENPRRRRRRKTTAHRRRVNTHRRRTSRPAKRRRIAGLVPKGSKRHRPVYYGTATTAGVRSPFKRLNPKGVSSMARKKHRRRRRHNPPFSLGGTRGIIGQVKESAIGALGIVAGRKLRGAVTQIGLGTAQPMVQTALSIGAAILLPIVARKGGAMVQKLANYASAAMIAEELKMLPGVGQYLGEYSPPLLGAVRGAIRTNFEVDGKRYSAPVIL